MNATAYEAMATGICYGRISDYVVTGKVGQGKYSQVFSARSKVRPSTDNDCVVKILKPAIQKKILREISILKDVRMGPSTVKLLDVLRDPISLCTALVFERSPNVKYKVLYIQMEENDIVDYLKQVLSALVHCHAQGIFHRDVKPSNIMCGAPSGPVRLIDWGLADYYTPGGRYTSKVGTMQYKPPELLMGYEYYDKQIDMWSFGCVFGSLLFSKRPFFCGAKTNIQQLATTVQLLGYADCAAYLEQLVVTMAKKNNRETFNWRDELSAYRDVSVPGLESLENPENSHKVSNSAVSLLRWCLQYNPKDRPTPSEALAHPYLNR
ncbi:CMGC/CK2 protein kinase [Sphaeroforma arctica JP610]|uniref:non-specific serine/threonine protein kinase n=1 Tax=Sphaeroforma arctica JP610 TaxID=667725 RepID=A0A0L0FW76_9EUKA|nr:CMGC/CK2 protein kinase [Sphaeroforma arctica JP610]KNC81062.1 CMGC/CK2 protein kinase [Sphaeroforma arctica JP610]|eukprot:XP_014154964.1 CMGC/CK2 protein kinase [Sphaeroforma arctica JP610]